MTDCKERKERTNSRGGKMKNYEGNYTFPPPPAPVPAYGPDSLTSGSLRMITHTDIFCLLPPSFHTLGIHIVLTTV
jgi:hypothetical protein